MTTTTTSEGRARITFSNLDYAIARLLLRDAYNADHTASYTDSNMTITGSSITATLHASEKKNKYDLQRYHVEVLSAYYAEATLKEMFAEYID